MGPAPSARRSRSPSFAEGELAAAKQLTEAATLIAAEPSALQLRCPPDHSFHPLNVDVAARFGLLPSAWHDPPRGTAT
jgi:hypothetical protein